MNIMTTVTIEHVRDSKYFTFCLPISASYKETMEVLDLMKQQIAALEKQIVEQQAEKKDKGE